ncbi:MAG: fatty acid desaturase [Geminicoccaceae bacterium]
MTMTEDTVTAAAVRARRLVPRPLLRDLGRRDDGQGLLFLVAHVLALVVTTLLLAAADGLWLLPAMVAQGFVLVHLFAPFHEATHGTAFRNRTLNEVVGWVTGLATLLEPTFFRLEHAAHHAHTQDEVQDPQFIPHSATVRGYLWYATGLPYWRNVATMLVLHAQGRFTPAEQAFVDPANRPKVQNEARLFLAIYAVIAIGAVLAGTWAPVTYWLLPMVLAQPWMRLVRMAEHGGCPRVADMLRNTRTVRAWAPLRWIAWNMPYHAEHHALPQIPFHALPRLHGVLGEHLEQLAEGYIDAQAQVLRAAH